MSYFNKIKEYVRNLSKERPKAEEVKPVFKPYNGGYSTPDWCGGSTNEEASKDQLQMKHAGNGAYHLVNDKGTVVGTVQLNAQRGNQNDGN